LNASLAHEGENSFSAPTVIVDGVDVSLLLTQRAAAGIIRQETALTKNGANCESVMGWDH
jgi:hypothetical protein